MPSAAELLPLLHRAREEVPGIELFDAHTHLGANDPDGYHCTRAELVELLDQADARGVVFPMHEPDGYPPPTTWCSPRPRPPDRLLVPFCRLDPQRGSARRGRALPRGGRARDQAPPPRRGLRARPSGAPGGVRARG